MLTIKKDDYDFFFPLLGTDEQAMLASAVFEWDDSIAINDEDIAAELYEWLNDLVVEIGFDKVYEVNDIGKRLEKISDYIFSVIEV
ncbi:MAG: hypothetical protein K0R46_2901 [Herbinix sp.]|jgi:hypothetical protein|nr:hypothetical protein [Herbinix sp.]